MEKMVLTPSLSGSALMDPSFFILRCLKYKIPSSEVRLFLSERTAFSRAIVDDQKRMQTALLVEIKSHKFRLPVFIIKYTAFSYPINLI